MTTLVAVSQRVDTIVAALRRKPGKRFSTAQLSAATGLSPTVLTSNMKTWMTKNERGMNHVHVEAAHGHAQYYFDPDHERTEPPAPIRGRSLVIANTDATGVVKVKRNGHAVRQPLAKVVFDEGGMLVAVTEDGRVIKGRWME